MKYAAIIFHVISTLRIFFRISDKQPVLFILGSVPGENRVLLNITERRTKVGHACFTKSINVTKNSLKDQKYTRWLAKTRVSIPR